MTDGTSVRTGNGCPGGGRGKSTETGLLLCAPQSTGAVGRDTTAAGRNGRPTQLACFCPGQEQFSVHHPVIVARRALALLVHIARQVPALQLEHLAEQLSELVTVERDGVVELELDGVVELELGDVVGQPKRCVVRVGRCVGQRLRPPRSRCRFAPPRPRPLRARGARPSFVASLAGAPWEMSARICRATVS